MPIFVIGLTSRTGDYDRTTAQTIASETGGLLLEAASPDEVRDLYLQVSGKLRAAHRVLLRVDPDHWQGNNADVILTIGSGPNALTLQRTLQR